MRTFIGTTVFRLIVLLGGRIYFSNYQQDSLYTFFNISNPSAVAVQSCYSGVAAMQADLDTKLDEILQKVNTTNLNPEDTIIVTGAILTGTFNEIHYESGAIKS